MAPISSQPQWVNMQTDFKFHYNSSCLRRVGIVKSLVSVCMFKQNIRGMSHGFTNKIKPKYVYIRLEMLSSTYIPVKSVKINI